MKNLLQRNGRGFTLIEVLLVIVIIAILAGIVLIAVNPARQVSQANNTQRKSDVKQVLNAVAQYAVENRGAFPAGIPTVSPLVVGSGAGEVNVCAALVPKYIAALPFDPTAPSAKYTSCSDYNTAYTIVNVGGRITVAAPSAELGETITVTQ